MDELSGRTVLDAENDIELPLLPMQGVVLMPGETLPLHIFLPQVLYKANSSHFIHIHRFLMTLFCISLYL